MSELRRTLLEDVFYPEHDPRKASSEYRHVHHKLVVELNEACWICGIRNSDLAKIIDLPMKRRWQLETHHSELEWAAERAFETNPAMLAKLIEDLNGQHPQEYLSTIVSGIHERINGNTSESLREFLDSEGNMLVLCATHHRGSLTGIHSVSYPAWKLQRWQVEGGWAFVKQPDRPGP